MYSKKKIGPRTEPYETRDVTSVMSDRAPLTDTRCLRFDRNDVIQLGVLPVILYEVSLERSRLWSLCSFPAELGLESWTIPHGATSPAYTYSSRHDN